MRLWVFVILAASVLVTIPIFYNTVITKKWRNKAEDEANSWYLWGFYFNPKDSRMFLPKRSGLGVTINFANPWAVVFFILIIVLIIALSKVKHLG